MAQTPQAAHHLDALLLHHVWALLPYPPAVYPVRDLCPLILLYDGQRQAAKTRGGRGSPGTSAVVAASVMGGVAAR